MPNENLISTLEQSLRQTRSARTRLAARLAELVAEADTVRAEFVEMDTLTVQTEAAIFRLLSSVLTASYAASHSPSDAELEAGMRQDTSTSGFTPRTVVVRDDMPPVRPDVD